MSYNKPPTENEKLGLTVVAQIAREAGLYQCFVDEFAKNGAPYRDFKTGALVLRCSVQSRAITANARVVRDHLPLLIYHLKNAKIGAILPDDIHVTWSSRHKHKIVFYVPIENLRMHLNQMSSSSGGFHLG